MKRYLGFSLLVLLVLVLAMPLTSCSDEGDDDDDTTDDDDDDDDDDTTDDDDDDDDTTDDDDDDVAEYPVSLKLDGELLTFSQNMMMDAFYYVSGDETNVGDEKVGITFPGKATGTFTSEDYVGFQVIDANGDEWYGGYEFSDFTVTVTGYGEVGDLIEGEFSGTVLSSSDDTTTAEITEGHFAVTRSDDD